MSRMSRRERQTGGKGKCEGNRLVFGDLTEKDARADLKVALIFY